MKYIPPLYADGTSKPADSSYVTGNAATGTPGDYVDGRAIEHPMREILEVIQTLGGLTPDEADTTQLRQAIEIGIAAAVGAIDTATIDTSGIVELADDDDAVSAIADDLALTPRGLMVGTELPVDALPYPYVEGLRFTLSQSPLANGGQVTVAAGTAFTLATPGSAAGLGILRHFVSEPWGSEDLDVDSTYYLRCQTDGNGYALFYTQKGTDDDAVPASRRGTPGGAAGGGFDSTQLDMLIAKITTGGPGSVPDVVNLANAPILRATVMKTGVVTAYNSTAEQFTFDANHVLHWARSPKLIIPTGYIAGISATHSGGYRFDVSSDRYRVFHSQSYDYSNNPLGQGVGSGDCKSQVTVEA